MELKTTLLDTEPKAQGSAAMPIELSSTWADILAFQHSGDVRRIPSFVEAFFIIWVSRADGTYMGYSCNYATSEPSPHPNCDAQIVASVRVNVEGRSKEALDKAGKRAHECLLEDFFASEHTLPLRNKLAEDLKKAHESKQRRVSSMVEVVDEQDFRRLLQGQRL